MARNKIGIVQQRRKKEGKTDYKKRLKLLKAGKPRLAIRKSLNNIWLQVIDYSQKGDKVLATAHSSELKKLGWEGSTGNMPAAYLTGLLLGKKVAGKKMGKCVLDIGLNPSIKGNRIYSALKGAVDGGLQVPHSKEILPPEERATGGHIKGFSKENYTSLKKKIEGK